MVAPQQLGLTLVFADFSDLPYLLRYLPPVPRYQKPEIPRRWYSLLMSPVNPDHIEEDDIPQGEHIDDYIAADVWQLMRRLDLIEGEWRSGPQENLKRIFARAPGPGIVCTPSALGAELFLWAFGYGNSPLEHMLSGVIDVAVEDLPKVVPGAIATRG